MKKDFNSGNNFVSFVVTPVFLCSEKGKEDNNLRYFEERAISMFSSYYPNIGYNKNGTCSQLIETLNIMDAKKIVDKLNFDILLNKEWRF